MENLPKGIVEGQKMSQPNLQRIEQEIPHIDRMPQIDGNIPDGVKDSVNKDIWDRLSKEDHPPERAD